MASKFWRNGKYGYRPLIFSFFRFVWLVPIVPLYLFVDTLVDRDFSVSKEEMLAVVNSVTLVSAEAWMRSHPVLSGIFVTVVVIWLISFFIQSRAAIVIKNNNLFINRYGFFKKGFDLANIKSIKIYDLGYFGIYYDFKTQAHLGFREFMFLARPGKENLSKFANEHGFEIL